MSTNKLKWLAALPNAAGVDPQGRATLVMFFTRNGYTVKQIVGLKQDALAGVVKFALQCEDSVATKAARAIIDLLVDLLATAESPPSEAELKKFITDRQFQLQPKQNMMSIYEALTSDDPGYIGFTPDPLNGMPFNPVWLQLAIEQLYGLPSKM